MFAYIACCFCTEGARKSVQLHNIGSMCVTALPYSNLFGCTKGLSGSLILFISYLFTARYSRTGDVFDCMFAFHGLYVSVAT